MKPIILIITLFCILLSTTAHAGLKIYYIRHAEGGHNVKRAWKESGIPESEWPAFVGDHEQLTPKGKLQANETIENLMEYEEAFDLIAVSPAWRTKHTILPYLKEVQAKGEIWPELIEFRAGRLILSPDLPVPDYEIFNQGDSIELTADEAPHFTLRADGKNEINFSQIEAKAGGTKGEAAAHRAIIKNVIDRVKEDYSGSNKSVLLVGHKASGSNLLMMLLNRRPEELPSMLNAGVWMVEEQASGEFELKMFNHVPLQCAD